LSSNFSLLFASTKKDTLIYLIHCFCLWCNFHVNREEERIIPTPAKIFLRIKRLIAKYEPNFEVNADSDVEYSLYAHGKGEVLFAQVSMMGEYVNFKYNPLVLEEDLKNSLNPQLLALLHDDGFHFNDIGIRLEKRILSALKKGFRLYKKLGLI